MAVGLVSVGSAPLSMSGSALFITRGQPVALSAVRSMIVGQAPHAVLLVGPTSVGKTTLALDLAAGLFCLDPDPSARPCRNCRGCRQLERGNHADMHRLAPEGPGGQIKVGDPRRPEPGTVRGLIGELALLPVEGGARVALIEAAHRLNEDAQHALLKTLEEPPPGVTIILCADEEERLLPTVRSRCARVRLGPVGSREIEGLLGEMGLADAPTAARLGRIAAGRPGLAVAYARSAEAAPIREELARSLLDLVDASAARRLSLGRDLLARAAELTSALVGGGGPPAVGEESGGSRPGRRGGRVAAGKLADVLGASVPAELPPDAADAADAADAGAEPRQGESASDAADIATASATAVRASAPERRRAALQLLDVWRDVARDLVIAQRDGAAELRDPSLLEELRVTAERVDAKAMVAFLENLGRVSEMIDGNVSPELAVDVLLLTWPRAAPAG